MLIKNKLLSNLIVTISGKIGLILIQFGTTLILSRLLMPEDFGVVAMCSLFLSISQMLIDSGMAGSIIYHKDVEEIELHTLFWTNLLISLIIYIILALTSSWIASFYKTPDLEAIIKIIGLSIIVHSFCLIQSTLLSKKLEFKTQRKILIISAVLSSIVALLLAYYQLGVWALVAQAILVKVFQALLFIHYGSYKPKFKFSLGSLKRHWKFGSRLLGSSFLKLLHDNLYVQIIGRTINLRDAGFYSQAYRFNEMPMKLISFPLERVIFPTLANSKNMLEKMYKLATAFILCLTPLFFLGSLLAEDLILVLLGNKWKESGWMLSLLLLGTIGSSLESLNRSFLKASGKTSILLKFDFAKRILNISILLVSMNWGIKGILVAFIINGFIGWFFNSYALRKALNYNLKKELLGLLSFLTLSIAAYFTTYHLSTLNDWSPVLAILLKSLVFVGIYIALVSIFKKKDVIDLYKELKPSKI